MPRKWTNKDIPKKQQELLEFENTRASIDVNLPPHKLFELFFDDEVINYLCDQSKIYANSKGNFTFHVTLGEFRASLAILLISGYTSLPRRRMYWEQTPDVFNCTVSDILTRNRFEEILRYLHLADNAKLIQGDKLVCYDESKVFECFPV